MTTAKERKKQQDLSKAYLAGEKIFDVKYRHNSRVSYLDANGDTIEGWIVGVGPIEPEPIYTIERKDRQSDDEIAESRLTLLLDPHV